MPLGVDADRVVEQSASRGLSASRAAISLFSAVEEMQHGRRRRLLGDRGQRLRLRRHRVARDVVALDDVDLARAVLGELVLQRAGGAGGADHDGARLTELAGGGEQLERRPS